MDTIAGYITRVLAAPDDERALQAVRADVKQLCLKFPLYPDLT
jgi:glycine/serine hydroxymethyltransferase